MSLIRKFKKLSPWIQILIIGIFIRLLLMPFFTHVDLLSTYNRAYSYAFEGESVLSTTDPLSHFFEVITLRLYDIFLPREWIQTFLGGELSTSTSRFVLFMLKIPYLLFDILSLYLLVKIFKLNRKKELELSIFYFLNPILIFGVYMFGRYETIPIAFILGALFFWKRDKQFWAALLFGLAPLTRMSFLLLIPVVTMLIGKNIKQKIGYFLLMILPFIVFLGLQNFMLTKTMADWLTDGTHVNYLWGTYIQTAADVKLPIFFSVYTVISFFAFLDWMVGNRDVHRVLKYISLVFASLYSISFLHPQYYAWGIPFFALAFLTEKKWSQFWILNVIVVLAFPFLLLRWNNAIIPEIVRPLSLGISSKNLFAFIGKFYDPYKLVSLSRAILTAVYTLFFIKLINMLSWNKLFNEELSIKQNLPRKG
ncbi:MAG: Uncharacterized protein XD93_0028 [candidate division WS6 bacterium 34_10]|uniref:Uncharacterized protein n=1 Tax=candidate division WS6 bacterium 34_10 TaxID=1641389 RepID=A0A101HJ68_9BACT|nr:MAG: Uncharacterized protein XD93_0028 [candidate division WS6 bacterium 34_10]